MEPINFAGALWRSWRLLLVLGLIGAGIAVLMPVHHPKEQKPVLHWQASAVVGSPPAGGSSFAGGLSGAQILFWANNSQVLTDLANAAQSAGVPIAPGQFGRYVSSQLGTPSPGASTTAPKNPRNGPSTVTLTALGESPQAALQLANLYAQVLGNDINAQAAAHAQSQTGTKPNSSSSSSSDSGTPPQVYTGYAIESLAGSASKAPLPSAGKFASRKVRVLLGFVLGALVGAAIVVVRALLDKRIRRPSQAVSAFGFPVIGEIPERPPVSADERAIPIAVATQPTAPEAEAFRMLRMSILFEPLAAATSAANDPLGALLGNGHGAFGPTVPVVPSLAGREPEDRRIVLVASPRYEETRPLVVANLAAVYSEAGERVILVHTGELGVGRFAAIVDGGLYDGEIRPEDVESRLDPSPIVNVSNLRLPLFLRNSGQLVTRGRELLQAAKCVTDVVIVETPGALSFHDAEALCRAVDVVVLVGECGKTRLAEARRTGDLLRRIGAPVLGVMVTNTRPTDGPVRSRGRHSASRGGRAPISSPAPALPEFTDVRTVTEEEPTASSQV